MTAFTLSQVIGAGPGSGVTLAADADYPKDKVNSTPWTTIGSIDATGSLTEVLSLTGKYQILMLWMSTMDIDDIATVKLTIDGTVIWNVDPLTNSANESYIGYNVEAMSESIICETSFLFEMQMDADTTITLNYLIRPLA